MARKKHRPEEIIRKLREAEILIGKGETVAEVARKLQVTPTTFFRWRKEYGGMRVEQARRLKQLEKENARLKRIVADYALDISILKEVTEGNF